MHTHGSFPAATCRATVFSARSSRRRSTTESSPRNAPARLATSVAAAARFVRCLAPRSCWRRWNARCDGKRRAHNAQCGRSDLISADRRDRSWTRSRDSPRNSASRARIRRGWIKVCSGTKARSRPRLGPRQSIVRRETSTGSARRRCGRRRRGRDVFGADGFADPNVGDIVRSLERRDATSRGGDRRLRLSLLRLRAAQSKGENFGGAGCLLSLLSRATRRLRGRF